MAEPSEFTNYQLYADPSLRRYRIDIDNVKLAKSPPYSASDFVHFDSLSYCGHDALEASLSGLGLTENSLLLDICAGLGSTSRFVNSRYGANVVAVDYIKTFMDLCDEINSLSGITKIRCIAGDATALDLEELGITGQCDVVYSIQSLYHIQDKPTLFAKFNEALKMGGFLYIEDHTRLNDLPLTEEEEGICKSFYFNSMLTQPTYTSVLEAAGFEVQFYEMKSVEWATHVYNRANRWLSNKDQMIETYGEVFWNSRVVSGIHISCRFYHNLGISLDEAKTRYSKIVEFIGESEFERWLGEEHKFTGAYLAAKKVR